MKILTSPLTIIAFCTATTVAGCGGGGGIDTASSTLITKTVNGRVADGYIQGATIFWDCNNNMKPDIDEISTKSSTGGEYIIAQAPTPKVPGTQCTLRAYIPATAVDESTGLAVGATYTMSSVDGHPEFISPLTTVLNLGGYTEEELRSKFPATASLAFTSDYIAAGDAGSQHHNASKVLAISLQSISGLVATDDTQARREVLSRALALVPIDSYKSLNATNAFLAAFKSNTPNLDQQTNLLSITLDKAEFQLVESAFNGSQDSRRAYIDLSLAAIKAHPEAILGNSVNWNLVPYNERSAWSTAIQGGG